MLNFFPVASRERSEEEVGPLQTVSEGERLVRIPLEDLKEGNTVNQ